ncbi:MAG: hypothetical protein K2J44_06545, partial [Ruminococcus sp.]|nr:hypothetical protein [Ruminococcus sp.]
IAEEKLLVSVFCLLSLMVRHGMACSFAYYDSSGEIVTESVDSPDYPEQLLLKILSVKVIADRRISVPSKNVSVCACVVSTTDAGNGFSSITDKIENHESTSILGVSQNSENNTDLPLWYLDENNNFVMV